MPSQHVLLTGPTGFLGSVVLAELLQAGYRVTAAVRHRSENFPPEAQQAVVGDLASCPDWSSALDRIDAVIHLAARAHVLKEDAEDPLSLFRKVNCDATLDLANAAVAAGVEQFVFVSTIGVNGAVTYGAAFGPDDEPNPRSPYAIAKWEAEQGLQEIAGKSRMALTIVRPPLILGDNPKGNLAAMHRMIARGLPLPLRSVTKNHRDFVSRERLSAFVVTALEDKRCHGHTFTICDGEPISTRTLIEREANRLHVAPRLFPIPPSLLSAALKMLGKSAIADQLCGDLEVDGSAAAAILPKHIGSSH